MRDFDRKWKQFEQDFEQDEKFTRRMVTFGFCATAVFMILLFALIGVAVVWIASHI